MTDQLSCPLSLQLDDSLPTDRPSVKAKPTQLMLLLGPILALISARLFDGMTLRNETQVSR